MEDNNTYIMCGPQSYFPDDVKTTCKCGAAICHRPNVPEPSVKLCIECTIEHWKANPDIKPTVTKEAITEVSLYNRRN